MHTKIQLASPDPAWPAIYQREAAKIRDVLGTILVSIHHIGSTSIPDIFAKPVIDMVAEVTDLGALDGISDRMQRMGYECMGEFGIAGRRYFRRDDTEGRRTHHVHTFRVGDAHVDRHLAFRDYLIAHRDAAQQYSALKQELITRYAGDSEAYIAGKEPFIKDCEAKALVWYRNG